MKKIGLAVLVVACGGTDGTGIPDGSPADGTAPNDGSVNDTSASDTGTNDTGTNDSGSSDASDAGTFTPLSVPNLVLWLEGDVSSSITTATTDAGVAKVTKWADQTTHHNDALGIMALQRNPSVKTGAIHSLNAVHFDQQPTLGFGNMLTILDNTDLSLQWGTGDFFIAFVADFDNGTSNANANLDLGNFWSKEPYLMGGTTNTAPPPATYTGVVVFGNVPGTTPSAGLFLGTANTTNDFISSSTAYNTGAAHLFAVRRRGTKLDLFVDNSNVASSTTTSPDVSQAKLPVRIGADGDANWARLDGDIGEMLAVKGALAVGDEANLIAYLRAKWATP